MSDNIEDIPDAYSQEEINQARDELKAMTPEDLLALRGELNRAQDNIVLPEAVAIAWTEVYSSKGNKINVTCRGVSGKQALDELADTLRYARERYNMHVGHSTVPVQPVDDTEPRYVPDEEIPAPQSNLVIDDIVVTTITRERKRDGNGDFLRVKGGAYTKYGAPAYDSVYPKAFDITKMSYGIEVAPPIGMLNAKIQAEVTQDGKKSKARVIQFS